MAITSYKHGVTWRDIPTTIVAPVTSDSGIPIIVGASPAFQKGKSYANIPRVYPNYESAVSEMGFSKDYKTYGISLAIYTYFALYNVGPIICINILNHEDDLAFQGTPVVDQPLTFTRGQLPFIARAMLPDSIEVKSDDGTITYDRDVDYIGSWMRNPATPNDLEYYYSLTAIPGGQIPLIGTHDVLISYTPVLPGNVNRTHIIGGIDINTGDTSGLEAIEKVYPMHTIIPGVIIVPNYSSDPEVAAITTAKADLINGCFRCIAANDIESETVVLKPMDVNLWKNTNNFTEDRMMACWPRIGLEKEDIWLSVAAGARMLKTDIDNANIPVESPSNKLLKMNKMLVGPYMNGREIIYAKDYSDMLNGQGVVTTVNWMGGHKLWGNNMACYPLRSTDPKDRWIPSRRMTDFVGNSLVQTIFQKVDKPGNRRLIDQIIDTTNLWLNSLVSSGNALGARVEFRHDENPDIEIIDGHYLFHVYEFFPIPAEWIEFVLELDLGYLSVLF